jgi:proteasome lid subunit RPN8/RPN11
VSGVLALPRSVRIAIEQEARAGHPEEVCGLLAGAVEGDSGVRCVTWHAPIDNAHPDRRGDRFELDPKQHLQAQKRARAEGLALVGVYHSHPDAGASPSETDHARAVEIWDGHPSWSYLIVSVTVDGVTSMRSWRLEEGRFLEERIEEAD